MEQEANINRVPPYTSYRSLRTLIEEMRAQGFPSHVDKDVMRKFSGSVRSQLVTALRFLKLITEDNETTPTLAGLVEAEQPDEWKQKLSAVLVDSYGSLLELPLANFTLTQLTKEFKERYKAKDDVIEKCVRFFVHAAKDAGIELSKRITDASRTRAPRRIGTTARRQDGLEREDGSTNGQGTLLPPPPPPRAETDPYQVLINILSPDMQDDEQTAVWTLIRYLKKKEVEQ